MQREGIERWCTYVLKKIWHVWGRMARAEGEVTAMVAWKNLAFWRAEQQKPRKTRVTHAGHFNPEGMWKGLSKQGGNLDASSTGHGALATGKQLNIRDNLIPHSRRNPTPGGEIAA